MEKITFIFCLASLLTNTLLRSQTAEQMRVQLQFFNHYGKIYQKGLKGPDLVGSRCLYDEWKPMKITTKDFEIDMAAVKINLYNSMLEVMYEGEEKLIYPMDFLYVSFKESGVLKKFAPAPNFKLEGTPLQGFMEVVGEESEQVLVHHYTGIKEPGPSANIVGGPTDNVLVKSTKTYIYSKGRLVYIKNKKQYVQYFGSKSKKAEKLMKERKTDFKDPYQLYEVLKLVRG